MDVKTTNDKFIKSDNFGSVWDVSQLDILTSLGHFLHLEDLAKTIGTCGV